MREHMGLFRGKRIGTGDWVEGWLVCGRWYVNGSPICAIFPDEQDFYPHCELTYYEAVDPDTIGECTGLKDKNGKLIFEGDIVRDMEVYYVHKRYVDMGIEDEALLEKYRNAGAVAEVKFCTENVGSCGCCYPKFEGSCFMAASVNLNCCEIISNVTDNPELLKGGEGA